MQAPQAAMPHPNFVPVNPSVSRRTHSSGVCGSTSTERVRPFTSSVIAINSSERFYGISARTASMYARASRRS